MGFLAGCISQSKACTPCCCLGLSGEFLPSLQHEGAAPRLSHCLHSLLHPPGSLNQSLRSFLSSKSSQDRISLGRLGEVNLLAMRKRRMCGAAFSCSQLCAGLWLVPLHTGGPGLLSKRELGAPKQRSSSPCSLGGCDGGPVCC